MADANYSSGNDLNNPAVTMTPDQQAAKIAQMTGANPAPSSSPAPTPSAPLNPQDAANAAKYSTPLPPNDPASLNGARANPNYIGPTNWATLQKQYSPYQLSQATTKDAQGNLFWNPSVDINSVGKSSSAPQFTAPPSPPTPSTTNLSSTPSPDSSTITRTGSTNDLSTAISAAAKNYSTSSLLPAIDNLLKQQQQLQEQQKQAEQDKVDNISSRLDALGNSDAQQKALEASRTLFNVTQTINTLQTINSKIADATAALDQGLLYEQNQPVRMTLLTGRSAALKAQGEATVGALQSAAEVLKGNLTLASAYATDTANAIKEDTANQMSALNTLLSLHNNALIQLTKDEQDTVTARMTNLKAINDSIDKQTQDVFDLAKTNPSAFVQGGVTYTDTRDQAIAKMAPFMAATEQAKQAQDAAKSAADIAKTKADTTLAFADAKKAGVAAAGGTGGGTAPGGLEAFSAQIQTMLADPRNVSPSDAIKYLEQVMGRLLTAKEQTYIKSQFSAKRNIENTPLTAAGVKSLGYDPIKHPDYIGMTPAQIKAKQPTPDTSSGGSVLSSVGNFFSGIYNSIMGK